MMFTEPKQHLWTVLPILLSELAYLLSKTMWIGSLNVLLCPAATFQSVILQRIMNVGHFLCSLYFMLQQLTHPRHKRTYQV